MRRLLLAAALAGAVLVVPAASASANGWTYAPCWWTYGGSYQMGLEKKPRACMWNGSNSHSHAQMVPIKNMRWRSFGGPTACGHGTFFYNSGYRAPVRFCLYRRKPGYEQGVLLYTRIRGVIGRGCTAVVDGERWCDPPGRQHHFRSRI
jgi:hypothetical protein